ncbi:2-hydroxy-3-oxopropionate reductase [Candidatus Koribacter versatilis Ellin345]|uniref:2-hydroxy-3-oxopropionate reductase n=1 Tax=Koribacter versatilis (strain Ellin345) TaxID=204669 RepID=Q1IQE6_KORVE|nr:NAD(P)-dependent oxidoreductase [Candidatus Koribacter versatilis]ABF40904.1 2-hydroxy-3-oxopropionate reductase [Candidatus Koribacter versatilis Ellin345]
MKVAFLGLGIMGRPMAANLAKAGNEVTVWNRTPKDVEGAHVAKTPAEAAKHADVVWMCVSDTNAVERVLFGDGGVEPVLRAGMVVVDSSTISPVETLKFAERVRAKGADYIDAPITGSKIGAESAQLIFMVGAKDETLKKLEPLFLQMGKKIVHMGEVGKGQASKISLNLQIACIYEGFIEGFKVATQLGVNPEKFVELVQSTMVRSGVVDYKAPFVLKRDYTPNFPLRLMRKDLLLVSDAAKQLELDLPGLKSVLEVYDEAHEAGMDDQDYAATLALLERN